MIYEHKIYIPNDTLGMMTYTYKTDYNPHDVRIEGLSIVGVGKLLYSESRLTDANNNDLDLNAYLPGHSALAVNDLYNKISGLYEELMSMISQQ